jgi:hypothetical protein
LDHSHGRFSRDLCCWNDGGRIAHPGLASNDTVNVRSGLRSNDRRRRQGPTSSVVDRIIGTAGYATGVEATARAAALAATVGLAGILVASGAVLVPLQRRIIRLDQPRNALEDMRKRWFWGHLGRSGLAVLSFALAVAVAIL